MKMKMGGFRPPSLQAPHPQKIEKVSKPSDPLPSNIVVIDNTLLGDVKKSLRVAYFKHVRGWVPDRPNKPALVRGSGWSLAMDHIWQRLCLDPRGKSPTTNRMDTVELGEEAWSIYCQHWIEELEIDPRELGPEQYKLYGYDAPLIIRNMLFNYINQRRSWLQRIRLIGVETPVVVPLCIDEEVVGNKTIYYGSKIDKIFANGPGTEFGWVDHKTTSSAVKGGSGLRTDWVDKWNPNPQADGYNYSQFIVHGKAFTGGLIDAALCHRENNECFTLINCDVSQPQLDCWMNATNFYTQIFLQQLKELEDLRDNGGVKVTTAMPVFACDGGSCAGQFGGCSYRTLCRQRANPEQWDEPPPGYIADRWGPFDTVVDHTVFGGKELAQALAYMNGEGEKDAN